MRPSYACSRLLQGRIALCRFASPNLLNFGTVLALFLAVESLDLHAQTRSLISPQIDVARRQAVPNNHPLWANAANDLGIVTPSDSVQDLTLVLNRPDEQEKAFEQILADQQNPASPNYHHWLTPQEVGDRFGLSDSDISAVTTWLQSQGLQVKWTAPSKVFIGFTGSAADVSRAFGTELHRYNVNGQTRISINSEASVPAALSPAVKAIRGLFTVNEQPQHVARSIYLESPQITSSSGDHFIGPGDFFRIYGLPSGTYGSGVTIGIVGRARTNFADITNFNSILGTSIPIPIEVVPTAFGGVDPGPAYTAPPGTGISTGEQGEATLDVMRAGSVAPQSKVLLVVATSTSGGIEIDAQYLVNTTPLPAQVMSISFGACESAAGPAGVNYWDALFKQAAAEGISSFVSSGDSGAAGCDRAFTAPPVSPQPNSPNYICSSSYATCVGGTEFNDIGSTQYWNPAYLGTTATGYIPEGGWNESWDGTTASVAASGGGVSSIIATPSWQQGVPGVPTANTGRYTPDISFSSSIHDGYFACFAAAGAGCVVTNGSFNFTAFGGTSAAAPGMAGIAALLDQYEAGPHGNLNPGLYHMSSVVPAAFNDVTPSTSGVSSCNINVPNMCNNSIPGATGLTGTQTGYALATGYDEVTGLGSLNVLTFLDAYSVGSKVTSPQMFINGPNYVNSYEPFNIIVGVNWSQYVARPTGTISLSVGNVTSAILPLTSSNNGTVSFSFTAGSIPVGNYTLTAQYTPDSASSNVYAASTGTKAFSVIVPPKVSPQIVVVPSAYTISNSVSFSTSVTVYAAQYYPPPTGSIQLSSGTYTSASVPLVNGQVTIQVPAGVLAVGNDQITGTFTPDAPGSQNYLVNSNATFVLNQGDRVTPSVQVLPNPPGTATTTQSVSVTIQVGTNNGLAPATGSFLVSRGNYTSAPAVIANGTGTVIIPAGSFAPGLDLLTATYTPDAQSSGLYSVATGSYSYGVYLAQAITPTLSIVPSNTTAAQPVTLAASVNGGTGNPVVTGLLRAFVPFSPSIDQTLSGGAATIIIPSGVLPLGSTTFSIQYFPDQQGTYSYNGTATSVTLNILKTAPTITVTPTPTGLSTQQSLQVEATVSGGPGALAATGNITFNAGSYTPVSVTLGANGTATVSFPAGSLPPGTTAITATYTGDGRYSSASGSSSVAVTAPTGAAFSLATAGSVNVPKGSATSTDITVTPINGFVGNVALTAAITASPAGAQNPPTLSFGSRSSINLINFNSSTGTLTITTTASSSASNAAPPLPGMHWYTRTATALACALILFVPLRRRSWHFVRAFILFALIAGAVSCGGGGGGGSNSGGGSGSGGGTGSPGTTSGQYTITVTGTSGSTTATSTLTLTVQ